MELSLYENAWHQVDLFTILTLLRKLFGFIKESSEKCILTFRTFLYFELDEMHLSYYVRGTFVMNKFLIDKCHSPAQKLSFVHYSQNKRLVPEHCLHDIISHALLSPHSSSLCSVTLVFQYAQGCSKLNVTFSERFSLSPLISIIFLLFSQNNPFFIVLTITCIEGLYICLCNVCLLHYLFSIMEKIIFIGFSL